LAIEALERGRKEAGEMKTLGIAIWTLALVVPLVIVLGSPTSKGDEVFLDDLIVDGSMCVGLGGRIYFLSWTPAQPVHSIVSSSQLILTP
jgi:hypothetical protein